MWELLVFIGIGITGFLIYLYVLRRVIQIPYPNECIFTNPDTNGALRSFKLVDEGSNIKWVMGTLNSKIFNDETVEKEFYQFLKRNVQIDIIIGPKIDQDSEALFKSIKQSSNVNLWMMDMNPKKHFKIMSDKHLFIEPAAHKEGEHSAYMILENVRSMVKDYKTLFENYKNQANLIN